MDFNRTFLDEIIPGMRFQGLLREKTGGGVSINNIIYCMFIVTGVFPRVSQALARYKIKS